MLLVLGALLTIGCTATTVDDVCPPELKSSTGNLRVHGDLCFHFRLEEQVDVHRANSLCQEHQGSLAIPKTETINNFLAGEIVDQGTPVWIGLERNRKGDLVWADGSELDWRNFDCDGNNCLLGDFFKLDPASGKWLDFVYSADHDWANGEAAFICQYSATSAAMQG